MCIIVEKLLSNLYKFIITPSLIILSLRVTGGLFLHDCCCSIFKVNVFFVCVLFIVCDHYLNSCRHCSVVEVQDDFFFHRFESIGTNELTIKYYCGLFKLSNTLFIISLKAITTSIYYYFIVYFTLLYSI